MSADAIACALQHQDLPFDSILVACALTELSDAEKIIIRDLVAQSRSKGADYAAAAYTRGLETGSHAVKACVDAGAK